jgi:histidinol-phosphate aminotransferase
VSEREERTWRDLVRAPLRAASAYHVAAYPNAIKLDANESPFALSRAAHDTLAEVMRRPELHRYPDASAAALRETVAARMGVEGAQLVFGNGSDELIGLLCGAFGEPPGKKRAGAVLFPSPTFVVFRTAAIAHGLEPVESPLGARFEADEDALLAAVARERPNLVFLATPNNPTGTEWPRATIARLLVQHPDVMVVVDEAYIAYSDARSCVDLALAHPNCVVLQTLSKIGLAGLRVGVLVGRAEVVAEVEKVRPPYNLNTLGLRAAHAILSRHWDELAAHFATVKAQREELRAKLSALPGVEVFPSGANFLLVRVAHAADLHAALVERGVVVRLFDRGALAGCLRITVGTAEENGWLVDAMRASLEQ